MGEAEALHQMRVGARRLRSDLRTFGKLLEPGWADGLREELRWLGDVLGDVRDLDVMLARLHRDAGELEPDLGPLFDALERRRERARAALLDALRAARYRELLDRLVEGATSPELTAAAEAPSGEALPPLARRAWRKLERKGTRLRDDSTDEDFHRVRVLAKRARYGAEAVGPALGPKRARRARKFAKRAAALQDVLGELQDSVVARATVLEVAGEHPAEGRFSLAAGRLVERELAKRAAARATFPAAWARLDRGRLRSWMGDP
jgi:CHAD domain-containing protein